MSDDRTCTQCARTIPSGAAFCPEYGPSAGARCPIFGEPEGESGEDVPGVVAAGTAPVERPALDAEIELDRGGETTDEPTQAVDAPSPEVGGLGEPTMPVDSRDEPRPSEPRPSTEPPPPSRSPLDDAPTTTIGATPVESSPTTAIPVTPPPAPPPPPPPQPPPGQVWSQPTPGGYPPPPGSNWDQGGRPKAKPANVVAALVAIVGSGLVVAGALLPWLTTGTGESVSGLDASDDAVILLALAGVGVLLAVLLLARVVPVVMKVLLLVVGVAAGALAAYDLIDINGLSDEVDLGAGLFVVIAGAVVLVVAGILASTRARSTR